MDEDGFWKIVQNAHDSSGGDMDQKCAALRRQVAALSKKDAPEFARLFDAKMDQAFVGRCGARRMSSMAGAATIALPIFAPR